MAEKYMERKPYLDILSILFLMALTFYYFYYFYSSFLRILFITVGTIVILTVTPYLLIRKYKEKLYKYKIANFFMDWHNYLGFPFVLVFFYLLCYLLTVNGIALTCPVASTSNSSPYFALFTPLCFS